MAEEIHVESSWHHHHAGARFAAVPLAWTAAVVVEHAGRLNIAEWHEWGSGAEPIGHKAFHSESRASQKGNPNTHANANPNRFAHANRDAETYSHADADAHSNPSTNPDADSERWNIDLAAARLR